jgi:hypothetical protein
VKGLLLLALIALATTAAAQETNAPRQRTTIKSDWKFPSPKVKEKFDRERKVTLYDLGDGFFAERVKLDGKELVVVAIPQNDDTLKTPDSELAFAVAGAALHLSTDFDKLFLGHDGAEFRFLTLSGGKAGVTIARDRKTAVVRLLPEEMQ